MSSSEIEAVLRQAFNECDAAGLSLTEPQKQILRQVLLQRLGDRPLSDSSAEAEGHNPLDELTDRQRQILLHFIAEQRSQNRSWKVQLLNDWLNGEDSGDMQFIRDLYGIQWLEQIEPFHIARYADLLSLKLNVGDRIEVANSLWEWVQDEGPCSQEWFPCTVVSLTEITEDGSIATSGYDHYTNAIIRFDNGMEYEVQGIYEWNRYNWRWAREAN